MQHFFQKLGKEESNGVGNRRYSNRIPYQRSKQESHIAAQQNRPSNVLFPVCSESSRKCFSKEALIQQVERRTGAVERSASGLCNLSMQYNQKVFKKGKKKKT